MHVLLDIIQGFVGLLLSPLGIVGLLAVFGYYLAHKKAISFYHGNQMTKQTANQSGEKPSNVKSSNVKSNENNVHSLPFYSASYVALQVLIPAILFLIAYNITAPYIYHSLLSTAYENHLSSLSTFQAKNFIDSAFALTKGNIPAQSSKLITEASLYLSSLMETGRFIKWGAAITLAIIFGALAYNRVSPRLRARNRVEWIVKAGLIICSIIAVLTTIGIVLSLLFESLRFFQKVPINEFLFGMQWSPQISIRPGQVSTQGAFGAIPLLAGTLLITCIAMLVAGPVGLMSAIFLSDYASPKFRSIAKPVLEVLAGIPTVVYGFFAVLTIAPLIRGWGESIGLTVASESALAAGLVMGIMIIPLVSSLSDDVISAVPQSMRDGSYGLGATKSETIRQVVLPAALPGIVSAMLLAVSRAIGETMIVVMAAGLAANLTINPLEAVTTVTVQIVTLLVGDQEFDSAKTLAAFALGLLLFVITLILNIIALRVVQKYREEYE